MIVVLGFVVAATAGALARAEAGRRWNRPDGLAVGTFVVNVTGAFALGLLHHQTPTVLTVAGIGGLGAYTTFSSFARDAVALAEARKVAVAAGYVLLTCAGGVAAAALGLALA